MEDTHNIILQSFTCILHKVFSFKLFSALILSLFFNPLMSFSRTSRTSRARTYFDTWLIPYKKKITVEGILYSCI